MKEVTGIPILLIPFDMIFKRTLPYNKYPELSFLIISIYCFFMVKFSIQTVDEVVEILKIGHAFVGLTIASWAGNISGMYLNIFLYTNNKDVLNATMAAKNKKTELATSSIIGS